MRKTTLVARMMRKWVHRRVYNSSRKEPGVGRNGRSGLDIPMCMKCIERRRPVGGSQESGQRGGRGQGGLIGSQGTSAGLKKWTGLLIHPDRRMRSQLYEGERRRHRHNHRHSLHNNNHMDRE